MDDLQCEFFRKTLPGNVSLGQSGTLLYVLTCDNLLLNRNWAINVLNGTNSLQPLGISK